MSAAPADRTPLGDLRHHYGGAYRISHIEQAHTWVAERRDDTGILRACDPEALRELIRADSAARPVPRCAP